MVPNQNGGNGHLLISFSTLCQVFQVNFFVLMSIIVFEIKFMVVHVFGCMKEEFVSKHILSDSGFFFLIDGYHSFRHKFYDLCV